MSRILVAMVVLASTAALAQTPTWPPNGFVPDANTATAIARAVLIPIYGAATIRGEEPLKAERVGEFWHVRGTSPAMERAASAPHAHGRTEQEDRDEDDRSEEDAAGQG